MEKISSPHDKLFREVWSDLRVARDFLSNYLPQKVLEIIDLDTLEIRKDSFIEGDGGKIHLARTRRVYYDLGRAIEK